MVAQVSFQRTEQKFLVRPEVVPELMAALRERLPVAEFIAGQPLTTVTSLYLDNDRADIYHLARTSRTEHIKLRVREYSYPDPAHPVPEECWVEFKGRRGEEREKIRFCLAKRHLLPFLAGADVAGAVTGNGDSRQLRHYAVIRDAVARLRLRPTLAVVYDRTAFEAPEGGLRVSVDARLRYHRVPRELDRMIEDVWASTFGTPEAWEPLAVLELKHAGAPPAWFGPLLEHFEVEGSRAFSKYVSAYERVHGPSWHPPQEAVVWDGCERRNGMGTEERWLSWRSSGPSGSTSSARRPYLQ
ncbi:MAG: VTC domain-containing protein [Deltaproteobacteria bacterium]|nr:VTC domain-containing protein [Deltaproteobacteria bacterium]